MPIPGLTIIAESINDSVPSTKKLYESGDLGGILELARFQDEKGAGCIDVNVGSRAPGFMADLVRRIQQVTSKPLAIDTPDPEVARAGLAAYDPSRAGGRKPLLNSVSALRAEMFDLCGVQPFRPILLVSERVEDGRSRPCRTAEETHEAARFLLAAARKSAIPNDDLIFDPGIAPLGSDVDGNLGRLLAAMQRLHHDPDFAGVHMSVGLSNFTVMLPPKRRDGSPLRSPLESAFLTKAMPLGLDMVIGSMKRNYELLPPGHPALQCVEDCIRTGGFESILRVREFYT
jgi:5-methyltetrahydrofolate corrinoid/iron sulfur protein methyltransferase